MLGMSIGDKRRLRRSWFNREDFELEGNTTYRLSGEYDLSDNCPSLIDVWISIYQGRQSISPNSDKGYAKS